MAGGGPAARVLRECRQGDVIELKELFVVDGEGSFHTARIPSGLAVVMTQTCDLVRSWDHPRDPRPYVIVAPVETIDEDRYGDVARGRVPALAALPWVGSGAVANLEAVQTLDKQHFVTCTLVSGPRSDEERRGFEFAVARKFGRAAIPDGARDSIQAMRKHIRDKAVKNGVQGEVLDRVDSIRIEPDPSWDANPVSAIIVLLVAESIFPYGQGTVDEAVKRSVEEIAAPKDRLQAIAQWLVDADPATGTASWLWSEYAAGLAELCQPQSPLTAISGEAIFLEDYSYKRFLKSDDIDVDDLSLS